MENLFEPQERKHKEVLKQYDWIQRGRFFEIVDGFLGEIGQLQETSEQDKHSVSYRKKQIFTLGLHHFNTLEAFDLFQEYISAKRFDSQVEAPSMYHVIWNNKKLWTSKYLPMLETDFFKEWQIVKENEGKFSRLMLAPDFMAGGNFKKLIEDFLILIHYLTPESDEDLSHRQWERAYIPITLALPEMDSFEELEALHNYVWMNAFGGIMVNPRGLDFLWDNKDAWMEKFEPRLEWEERNPSSKLPVSNFAMNLLDVFTKESILNNPLPIEMLLDKSLFYPASGFDGGVVKHFGKEVQSFVYCDYAIAEDAFMENLNSFLGYDLVANRPLAMDELVPNGWNVQMPPNVSVEAYKKHNKVIQKPFAHWAIYERSAHFDENHGPKRFSLIFIGGEAVASYQALYWSNKKSAWALAIIQPGTGFGFNWTDFRDKNAPFAWVVCNNPHGQPQTILYGGIGKDYSDFQWDGYNYDKTIHPYYSQRPFGKVTVWKRND